MPVDAHVAQVTTAAVLDTLDNTGRGYIGRQARLLGANDAAMRRLDAAAAFPPALKGLMVQTSPEMCEQLGIDPKTLLMGTWLGGLGLLITNLWLCVDELRGTLKL